jgi:hypothetical protein
VSPIQSSFHTLINSQFGSPISNHLSWHQCRSTFCYSQLSRLSLHRLVDSLPLALNEHSRLKTLGTQFPVMEVSQIEWIANLLWVSLPICIIIASLLSTKCLWVVLLNKSLPASHLRSRWNLSEASANISSIKVLLLKA